MFPDQRHTSSLPLDIILGIGIGKLKFGVTETEAQVILGQSDKVNTTAAHCKRLQFNEVMLELSFEPENSNRLGWMEVHHPQATLFGEQLIGQTKQYVLNSLKQELGQPSGYEDYGSFESVFYENQWLELIFEFGRLKNLNFGVLYSEENEPLWPTI